MENVVNRTLEVKKTNTIVRNSVMKNVVKYLCALLMIIGTSTSAWGDVTGYIFTNKSFATSGGGWKSDVDGNGYNDSNGGVQCNNSHKGKAHTTDEVSNVSTVIVVYSADGTGGSIKVKIGTNDTQTFDLPNPKVGTGADACAVFDYPTAQSGSVSVEGYATSSNIYLRGVYIFHGTQSCNAIDITSTVILPAGSETYTASDWKNNGVTAGGYGYPGLYSTGSGSSNYCVIVGRAYDTNNANGIQFKEYAGVIIVHGITSSGGVTAEIKYAELGSGKGLTIDLTGATSKTAQTSGTTTITTTSTNATLVIRKPTSGAGYIKTIKISPNCTAPTLTLSSSSTTMTYGDNSNTFTITKTTNSSGTISWTSSATDVATVDDGVVSVLKAGTATISCTVAAESDYCEKTVDHELTVNPACPTLAKGSDAKALTAGSITSTSATLSGGIVTYKGGADLTAYGFVYGTSADPTTSNSTANVGVNIDANTAFGSKSITGLSPNTTYYARVYGTNGCGTSYSPDGTTGYITFTTLQRYTISYDKNGGGGTISDQYKDHGATATLNSGNNFSKTGYELTGWNTASDGKGTGYDLGNDYTANADVTMYAVWSAEDYTITLDNQSATSAGTESITVTYDASTNLTGTAITVPTKTGYTFGGYYTSTGGGGDQIIAANGSVNASVDGYTDASKNWGYANDLVLYAKWTANTISLTLSRNDVTGSDGSATITFDGTALNSSPTHATNSDANFSLYGYYAEAGMTNKILDASGNVVDATVSGYITSGKWTRDEATTLYAKWSKDMYTVSFNMNGHGTQVDDQEVESGEKAVDPGTTDIVDWHITGWYTESVGGTKWDFSTNTVSGNTTLYAHWAAKTYSTSYKAWCEPNISFSGDIHLTSVNGVSVYSTSTTGNLLHIISEDLAGVDKLDIKYLDADNDDAEVANTSSLFRLCNDGTSNYNVADGTQINVSASNTCDLTYSISYTPNAHNTTNHYKLQVTMKRGSRIMKTVTKDLYGRSLPEEFVIAAKNNNDNQWYALPNTIVDNNSAISPTKITVDNTTTPTKATYAPSTTVYKGAGRYASGTNVYGIGFTTDGTDQFKIRKNSNYVYLSTTGSSKYQDFYLLSTSGASFGAYNITVPSDDSDDTGKELGIYGNNFGYFKYATVDAVYILPIEHELVEKPATVTEWGQKSVILDVDAQNIASTQAHIGNGAAEEAATFEQTKTSVKNAASKYNYTLTFSTTDFSAHKGELLYVDWLDGEDEVVSTSMITIPWIIDGTKTMSEVDATKGHWDTEVHVLPGATLTADGGSFAGSTVVVKQLEIYPGAKVDVTTGTLTATTLVLRNGWTRANGKNYDVAKLYVKPSTGTLKATSVYADWYIDYDKFYPIAVPWNVTVGDIRYKNSNVVPTVSANGHIRLQYYDGAQRASGGGVGSNWKKYGDGTNPAVPITLVPAQGYAMTAKRPTGKAFSIVRMPLTLPSGTWAEGSWTSGGEKGEVSGTHKDQVSVTAHTGSDAWYTKGWNFVANPYMATFNGNNDEITGKVVGQDGGSVKYATIPDVMYDDYDQIQINTGTPGLKPFAGFFVQVATGVTSLTFSNGQIISSAPARYTNEPEAIPEQEAYISLSHENGSDQMGLIIGADYTADYEVNADLAKILGEANTLKTYLHYTDMDFAYLAINEQLASDEIPVTVKIPAAGEYTYSMRNSSTVDQLEGLYLIDYLTGTTTNLIYDDYTFTSTTAGTISNRFAINAVVGERQVPTEVDISGADKDGTAAVKFIWHDKVYVLHNNVIYDSTGKRVYEINK